MEQFDAVVIGSGIGGLAAARALAQFGHARVLVLEQHYTLGGMTHEFSRDGRYEFPTGMHYLGAGSAPFLDFLTDGKAQFAPLPDEFEVLHLAGGEEFPIPASGDRFRARLKEQFPDEADAVDRFFATVGPARTGLAARNVLSSFPAVVRRLGFPIVERLYPATYRTLHDQLARHFRDPRLRAVLAARWQLYGTPPEAAAFGYHASIPLTYYSDGGTHPVGGPKAISGLILESLERRGVLLRPRQQVHRILVERGRAAGVEVEDRATGQRYEVRAPTVVSGVGVRNTYALLGRELPELPAEMSTLMLFAGLTKSPAAFGIRGENHWFVEDDSLYVSFASLNDPAARFHTVEVLQLVDPSHFDAWRGADRPEEYRAFKDATIDRIVRRLDEHWRGFADNVAFTELATPLTFETYQRSARGAFYGLSATPQRLRSDVAGCRTPVKGVVVAGQDAWNAGVLAAAAGGFMAANAVLKPRQVQAMWQAIRAPQPASTPWSGYLRVSRIESLTPTVRRIRLAPLDGDTLPFSFTAGQYVTVGLPVAVEPIERSYSICSDPAERSFVEIAVKHEPQGLGSTFLHEEVETGQALRVTGPLGEFTYEPGPGTLLLIAGGIGITPLLSVVRAAAGSGPIVLLASFRAGERHLFEDDLAALRARVPDVQVVLYGGGHGRIDRRALQPHVRDASRVHLCGPPSMMQDVLGLLTTLGVPRDAIRTEAFVSGHSTQTRRERAHAIELAATVAEFTITDGDGAFPCRPGETILGVANAAHVPFSQSCGEGACGTCRVRVLSGHCETDTRGMFSTDELDAGWRLACQTLPTEDVRIGRS
ncbi:2Fe-2S iron-sulfur cluster-binding protein [Cryptosporangium aurantiacum]|uniref:Ferredoxin-NADP reductase n=1 Tax=Cryptosporangium aurantiacum TaxID=134849 RepID=A0A1M7RAK0_9ACTN|nr:2Fe-2S iron-sulfur cluster-binding protein [Cryptosporangium aurantiacum]SHN43139.1 Ferredoxin-NADP reductase [Cryptosporangium aurantiacum]